jgi:hypothetical protein
MGASERKELPEDLLRGRNRFRAWRKGRRKAGNRIPRPLWALAVRLSNTHGLSRTATALGLDYYSLKKQVEATARSQPPSPAFVELPSPVVIGKQCLFELDNGAGATMRVQLVGYDTADVEVLARNLWSAK